MNTQTLVFSAREAHNWINGPQVESHRFYRLTSFDGIKLTRKSDPHGVTIEATSFHPADDTAEPFSDEIRFTVWGDEVMHLINIAGDIEVTIEEVRG